MGRNRAKSLPYRSWWQNPDSWEAWPGHMKTAAEKDYLLFVSQNWLKCFLNSCKHFPAGGPKCLLGPVRFGKWKILGCDAVASAQCYVFPVWISGSKKQRFQNTKQGQSMEAFWHSVHVQRLLGQFRQLNKTSFLMHNLISFFISHIVMNIEYRLTRPCLSVLWLEMW